MTTRDGGHEDDWNYLAQIAGQVELSMVDQGFYDTKVRVNFVRDDGTQVPASRT